MVPSSSRPGTSRRSFLATVTGLASMPVVGRARGADGERASRGVDVERTTHQTVEPRAHLPIEGLMEAVGDGDVVYGAVSDGFAVVDVGDPADPQLLAEHRPLLDDIDGGPVGHVWDVAVDGDRLLVGGPAAFDALQAFAVFDVSDPADPERVAYHLLDHDVHNLTLDGDVAYLTGSGLERSPVVAFDVSDEPREVARFTPVHYGQVSDTIHDVVVQGNVLYAAYWDLGTWLIDVSDPAAPEPIVQVGFEGAVGGHSPNTLPGNSHYAHPGPDGNVLAVGKEAFAREDEQAGAPGGIELWDVSDPASASREAIIAPPAPDGIEGARTAHNFGWRGDRLYTSWYSGGVRVYEVVDPAEPRLLGGWQGAGTSFWTAIPIAEGFVGADHAGPIGNDESGAGLYAFPEPSGDGEPADLMEPLAPADVTTEFEAARTGTPESGPTSSSTGTPRPTASPTDPSAGGTPTSTQTDSPGFGIPAGLAAAGLAGWRLWTRRDER